MMMVLKLRGIAVRFALLALRCRVRRLLLGCRIWEVVHWRIGRILVIVIYMVVVVVDDDDEKKVIEGDDMN